MESMPINDSEDERHGSPLLGKKHKKDKMNTSQPLKLDV